MGLLWLEVVLGLAHSQCRRNVFMEPLRLESQSMRGQARLFQLFYFAEQESMLELSLKTMYLSTQDTLLKHRSVRYNSLLNLKKNSFDF